MSIDLLDYQRVAPQRSSGVRPVCIGNAGEHAWADLLTVMKGEHKVQPPIARERLVGTCLSLQTPADFVQGGQDSPRLRGGPLAHTPAGTEKLMSMGRTSPCSSRSAKTRRASAWALAAASAAVLPYASAPGKSLTSASQRPSSSGSHSRVNCMGRLPMSVSLPRRPLRCITSAMSSDKGTEAAQRRIPLGVRLE